MRRAGTDRCVDRSTRYVEKRYAPSMENGLLICWKTPL